jgi:hypothetical protein
MKLMAILLTGLKFRQFTFKKPREKGTKELAKMCYCVGYANDLLFHKKTHSSVRRPSPIKKNK